MSQAQLIVKLTNYLRSTVEAGKDESKAQRIVHAPQIGLEPRPRFLSGLRSPMLPSVPMHVLNKNHTTMANSLDSRQCVRQHIWTAKLKGIRLEPRRKTVDNTINRQNDRYLVKENRSPGHFSCLGGLNFCPRGLFQQDLLRCVNTVQQIHKALIVSSSRMNRKFIAALKAEFVNAAIEKLCPPEEKRAAVAQCMSSPAVGAQDTSTVESGCIDLAFWSAPTFPGTVTTSVTWRFDCMMYVRKTSAMNRLTNDVLKVPYAKKGPRNESWHQEGEERNE